MKTFTFKQSIMKKMMVTLIFVLFYTLTIQAQTALHFDGINDKVICSNTASLELSNTSFTLEAWIKADSWQANVWEGSIINKEDYTGNLGYMIRVGNNGNISLNFGSNNGSSWKEVATSNNPLSLNTWYHIAGVWNDVTKESTIYLDGVVVASATFAGVSVLSSTVDLSIGNDTPTGNRPFHGVIDDARIWNVARTTAEIINNKDAELLGTETGLVAYYKLNEGTPCADNTAITTVMDSSPNGNSGTMNNLGLSNGSCTSNFTTGVFSSTPCTDPSALSASVIGGTASLSWTENGASTIWDIEYGASGYTQGAGTTVLGVAQPYDLTGLATYTSYDYYVRSYCGSGSASSWVGPYTFSTTCSIGPSSLIPPLSQLVDEDFESGLGVFTSTTSGDDAFTTGNAAASTSGYWGVSSTNSSNFAFINEDACNCNSSDVKLISPVLDLTNSSNTYMTFDYAFYNSGFFDIVVSTDGGTTWSSSILSIASTSGNPSDWGNNNNVSLSAYNGQSNVKVAFLYNDNGVWGYGAAVDNVEIWTESSSSANVQTAINTSTPGSVEHYLGAGQIVHFYDQSTGNIMCTIDNSVSTHDYGCTTVEVDRAGTGAVEFANTDTDSYMFSKSLKITPTNNTSNDASGGYTITLYYSDAEMTGWETATGESRNNIQLHKVDGDNHVYDVTAGNPSGLSITSSATTYAAFNSDHALSATFTNGFSGFGAGVPSSPLPVELTYFQAKKDKKTALLNWETASEENNKGFHIEHSNNGRDFENIGWMAGHGNSVEIQQYEFVHEKPVTGINYYRLTQEDFDGTTSQSEVRSVLFEAAFGFTVYPNPSKLKGSTNIQFITENAQEINIRILEISGKEVFSMNRNINEGDNILPLSHDLLSNGVYIISITHNGGTENVKLSVVE